MKKPANYSLTKVKLLKGGGIDVTFRETIISGGVTDVKDWNLQNSENPHPDLVDKLNELKQYLAKCYNLDLIVNLAHNKGISEKEQAAFNVVKKIINNVYLENIKKLDVTGIAISGEIDNDKDKRSVIITGTYLQENNSKTALNSPRIKLGNDQFKFEADVQELVNDIEEEVSLYLFNGKKSQLSMFDNQDEEEEPKNLKKVV